jgi:hypothetical protein
MITTILLSLLFLLAPSFGASFSSPTDNWYWGWRENTKEIIAYRTNGETNTLHVDGLQRVVKVQRLSSETAIAFLSINDQTAPYELSSDSAEPFIGDADAEIIQSLTGWGFIVQAAVEPYFLLVPDTPHFEYGIILNTQNNTYSTIKIDPDSRICSDYLSSCVRVSQDGQSIRYISAIKDEEVVTGFKITEYHFASSVDVTLYEYHVQNDEKDYYHQIGCDPDLYGSRWICRHASEAQNTSLLQYWLVESDGSVNSFKEDEWLYRWNIFFSDNNLITVDYVEGTLTIDAETPEKSKTIFIDRNLQTHYVVQVQNENILILSSGDWQLYTEDDSLQFLGTVPCCPPQYLMSQNKRWLGAVTSSGDQYQDVVWDLSNSKLVFENPPTGLRYFGFSDNNFYYTDDQTLDRQTYFYTGEAIIKLPTGGIYFEIISDSELLFQSFGQNNQVQGIYRYDVETETFLLIAENTEHINI